MADRIHREVDDILHELEPLPGDRPRETGPWRRTRAAIVGELRDLNRDRDFRAALNGCGVLALAESDLLADALDALMGIAADRAPIAAHVLGHAGMAEWVLSLLMAEANLRVGNVRGFVDVLNAMTQRLRARHFADSDVVLCEDGSAVIPADAATFGAYRDLRGFGASQRPAGKPGRRPKGAKPSKGTPRPRISEEKIADAGRLGSAAWCAKHASDLNRSDKAQEKAALARYDRARFHWRKSQSRSTN